MYTDFYKVKGFGVVQLFVRLGHFKKGEGEKKLSCKAHTGIRELRDPAVSPPPLSPANQTAGESHRGHCVRIKPTVKAGLLAKGRHYCHSTLCSSRFLMPGIIKYRVIN